MTYRTYIQDSSNLDINHPLMIGWFNKLTDLVSMRIFYHWHNKLWMEGSTKETFQPSDFKPMGIVGCWNDHPTWDPTLMAPVKVWTSWPNAKIQICNSLTPAKPNLDWQQVITTKSDNKGLPPRGCSMYIYFLLYHMMLISYTGLVSVYMHRSLFMWYCQGFRKPIKIRSHAII